MPPKSAPMTQAAIRRMIKENVDAAIAAERARHANVGNDARGSGPARGQDVAPAARECTFVGFMKCNPTAFCEGKKVRFAAATLQGPALTWWNTKVATMGLETVNQMPWTEMKQLMTAEFCPIEEVQRMEHELWNLKVKEYNIVAYTQRFNELALMCPRMVEPERVKVDAYIRGLTDNIKGEVTSSKPANLNEAVRMAHKLMDQKSQARDERILEGKKRKWESFQSGNSSGKGNQRDNSRQTLQNNQRQGNARAMVTTPTDGKLPLCERCFTRHVGQCTIKCHKCGKVGHKSRYCKEKNVATGANALPILLDLSCLWYVQGHTGTVDQGGHLRILLSKFLLLLRVIEEEVGDEMIGDEVEKLWCDVSKLGTSMEVLEGACKLLRGVRVRSWRISLEGFLLPVLLLVVMVVMVVIVGVVIVVNCVSLHALSTSGSCGDEIDNVCISVTNEIVLLRETRMDGKVFVLASLDNATYSASAEDIAVQFCFFNIQLTSLSPWNCIPSMSMLMEQHFSWGHWGQSYHKLTPFVLDERGPEETFSTDILLSLWCEQLLQPKIDYGECFEDESIVLSSLNYDVAVHPFDNAVLFRCSRSGSLMFNAFFFKISMECLVQNFVPLFRNTCEDLVFLEAHEEIVVWCSVELDSSEVRPAGIFAMKTVMLLPILCSSISSSCPLANQLAQLCSGNTLFRLFAHHILFLVYE
ncbi:reverse transcriptase domain-containing protein [Tanacetum coccineum]